VTLFNCEARVVSDLVCVCGRKAFHGTSTKDHQWRPPQLAASLNSNSTYDVCFWQIVLQKSFCTADQKFSGL
jgi:hypothetical protein